MSARHASAPWIFFTALGLFLALLSPVLAQQVDATLSGNLFSDSDGDGEADPGDVIQYTLTVNTSGSPEVMGVEVLAALDVHTSLVSGSVNVSPIARDDFFSTVGNTRLLVGVSPSDEPSVQAAGSLFDNDVEFAGDVFSLDMFHSVSAQGGSVEINPDGTFTYDPPVGFEGTDTFGYSIIDSFGYPSSAQVSIEVDEMVWYVDGLAPMGGDGRSASPFKSLFDVSAPGGVGDVDASGEVIALLTGDGSYIGAVELEDDQQFLGQGSDIQVGGHTLITGSPAQAPTINRAAGLVMQLASGNTVRGVDLVADGGEGMVGSNFGILTVTKVAIDATGGMGVSLTTGIADVTFGSISSASSLGTGITLDGVSGSFTVNGATSVTASTGDGLRIQNSPGTATFNGLSITSTPGRGLFVNNSGSVNVQGLGNSILSTGNAALSVSNAVVNMTFDSLTSDSSVAQGIVINQCSGTVAVTGTTAVTSSSLDSVSVASGSASVSLGTLNITSIGGRGLTANVNTGTLSTIGGTISTGIFPAVDIASTPLGVVLTSVSCSGGTEPGIELNSTSGSFSVVGDGADTSLGGNGSGGTIANFTGSDGSPSGIGIRLNSAQNVSLNRMQLNDFQNFAIWGNSVTGFTMDHCTISGVNGTSAAADEGSISFSNLTGSDSGGGFPTRISRSVIGGGFEDNINISNTSGTLTRLLIDDCDINENSTAQGNDGVLVEAAQTAGVNVTINNSRLTSARGDLFQANVANTGTMDVVFTDNTVTNGHPNIVGGGGGVTLSGGGSGSNVTMTYSVAGNTFRDALGNALTVFRGSGAGSFSGTIDSNDFGASGAADSGSAQANAIDITSNGSGSHTVAITDNDIWQYNENGIRLGAGDGTSRLDATVTGNDITEPGAFAFNGIQAVAGTTSGDTNIICATIGGVGALANSIVGSGGQFGDPDFRLRQRFNTSFALPGYAGASGDTAAVIAFVQGNNTGTPDGSVNVSGSGFVGTCP